MTIPWRAILRHPAFRRSLFLGLLVGVGYALHRGLPPEPRWERAWTFHNVFFSPDGSRVLVTSWHPDGRIPRVEVWDVASGQTLVRACARPGKLHVEEVSPDFHWWAGVIGPEDRPESPLYLVDLSTGEERAFGTDGKGVAEPPYEVQFSPDGALLALKSWRSQPPAHPPTENHHIMIETATGRALDRVPENYRSPGFTADGRYFLYRLRGTTGPKGEEYQLVRWDVAARRGLAPLGPFGPFIFLSPDGRTLLDLEYSGSGVRRLALWDVARGSRTVLGPPRAHPLVVFSGDGRRLFLGPYGDDGPAQLWDPATPRLVADLPPRPCTFAAFSKDSHYLLAVTDEVGGSPRFSVRAAADGRLLWEHAGYEKCERDLAFSSDSSTVVLADCEKRRVEVIDTATGAIRAVLDPFRDAPVQWSRWGIAAASGSRILLCARAHEDPPPPLPPWLAWLVRFLPGFDGGAEPHWAPYMAAVVDTGTDRVVYRARAADFSPAIALGEVARLSPDGRSLLSTHTAGDDDLVKCFDVHGRKPWRWVVGVPLTAGAILLGGRVLWRRVRSRRAAKPQPASV